MYSRVEQVLDHYNIEHEKKRGSTEILFLCPFHKDTHLGSTMFNVDKEVFHCWACDAKGNIFEFVSKLSDCTIMQAEALIRSNFTSTEVKDFYVRDVNDIQEKSVKDAYNTLADKVIDRILNVIQNKKVPFQFMVDWMNRLPWICHDEGNELKKEKNLLLLYQKFNQEFQLLNNGEINVETVA